MSTTHNNSDHLRAITQPRSIHYSSVKSSGDKSGSARTSLGMGGVVSALSAVFCGSSRQQQEDEEQLPTANGVNPYDNHNSNSLYLDLDQNRHSCRTYNGKLAAGPQLPSHESSYKTAEDSSSEYYSFSDQESPRQPISQQGAAVPQAASRQQAGLEQTDNVQLAAPPQPSSRQCNANSQYTAVPRLNNGRYSSIPQLDFPYMDEDSDPSQLSGSEASPRLDAIGSNHQNLDYVTNALDGIIVVEPGSSDRIERIVETNHVQTLDDTEEVIDRAETQSIGDNEVVEISDVEYSADEEQEDDEVDSVQSEEEYERVESELEELEASGEGLEEGHVCDSDCDHSEYEIEDESESEYEEEHTCDSACEHSAEEDVVNSESDYESEAEESVDIDGGVIEISDNEASCDEEQEPDSDEDLVECNSDCLSDCDGNHHECSSECGCDAFQTDSDDENLTNGVDIDSEGRKACTMTANTATDNHIPPPPLQTNITSNYTPRRPLRAQHSLPSPNEILNELTSPSKTSLLTEKNNNRLQRNHSQRFPLHSDTDMMGELRTALDARVRRSASCRETAIDYRKRFAHLSNNDSDIPENFSKLDVKEREMRRKERRTRLRTLELKREQFLDEVRDGIEENVTDRIYRDAITQEMV